LLSRSSVLAIIEELERLHTVLKAPLKQELEAARSTSRAEGAAKATAAAALAATAAKPPKPPKSPKEWEKEKKAAVIKARNEATVKAQAEAIISLETAVKKASEDAINSTLQSLLGLLYLSSLLDPYAPYSAERAACLYSVHQSKSSLTQDDINTLCYVGRLLTMKSYYSLESHQDVLAGCKDIALRIISNPEADVHPTIPQGITGKTLKHIVEAITALDFFKNAPGQPAAAAVAVAAMPRRASGMGTPVDIGSAVVMSHAQQAYHHHQHQQSHTPAPYYEVSNDDSRLQAAMPIVAGLSQNPQQHPLPATPALNVPSAAAPLPAATFVQKQDIQVPKPGPTSQTVSDVAVEKTEKETLNPKPEKEENLMKKFFGGVANGATVQQHKEQEQKQSSGSLFFDNDFQLGIEGVSLEADTNRSTFNEKIKIKSDAAPVFAPTPTALPTPSPHVLPVPGSVAAKKRRNHSSRGSSQSRENGASPFLTEAAGVGGSIKAFGGATKGRGGNAKKQAIQQGKPAVQQQQAPQHPPQLQQQRRRQEHHSPSGAPSGSADAATTAGARRPNSKNGHYRRKTRMQQSQAQPQQA
jgi:hypothetical protein